MTDPTPTVMQAMSAVMADVQAIRKADRNEQQRFLFRGIDSVMNAVGPALRKHGVVIVPEHVETHYRDTQTTTGKAAREVTAIVTYRAYGPAGDSIVMQAPGESMDSGDKGTPKAMSVAYRTLLLQALTIPTDEPDPDAATYERAHLHAPPPTTEPAGGTGEAMTERTRGRLFALLSERGVTEPDAQRAGMARVLGRPVESRSSLTEWEARRVIASLTGGAS